MNKTTILILVIIISTTFPSCTFLDKLKNKTNSQKESNISNEAEQAFSKDPGFAKLLELQKEAEKANQSINEASNSESYIDKATKSL